MKILFVGQHFPRPNNPTIGTWALAQLRALQALGHEVRVLSPVALIPTVVQRVLQRGSSATCPARHDWNGIVAYYPKWSVYPVGPLGRMVRAAPRLFVGPGWWQLSGLAKEILREFVPDVIFAHHAAFGGFIASKLAAHAGTPWFVTDHDYEELENCASNPLRWSHYHDTLRSVSQWFAVSERMLQIMRSVFPDVDCRVLHNGADPSDPRRALVPRPAEYQGAKLVFSAGFFYERKNVPLTVKVFDAVADTHPDLIFVLAGGGDTEPEVKQAIDGARNRSRIRFLGRIDHAAVLQHMCWADIFISIGAREPFATVFSEAMMAGTPIIFCEDGGIADLAKSGVHGIGVAPGSIAAAVDALQILVADDVLREAMGQNARQLAAVQLTWEANARALVRIFRDRIAKGPLPAS